MTMPLAAELRLLRLAHWARDRQKGRRRITSLGDLDRAFVDVDHAFKQSSDAGLAALEQLCFVQPPGLPPDPHSAAYRTAQLDLYRHISGRDRYDPQTAEVSDFDFEGLKDRPFPYFTGSPRQVGEQLIGQGHLIRTLDLKPGASVVEFGPGWGNVTMALAQMGHAVTAVEIDTLMVRLLRYRAAQLSLKSLEIVQTDMLSFRPRAKVDAIVFFESFHHCDDHLALLDRLAEWLADGGKVIFAGEPIAPFPYAWGLRLDGLSLWSTRKYGWLELGFNRRYFLETLAAKGWSVRRHRQRIAHIADAYIATRA